MIMVDEKYREHFFSKKFIYAVGCVSCLLLSSRLFSLELSIFIEREKHSRKRKLSCARQEHLIETKYKQSYIRLLFNTTKKKEFFYVFRSIEDDEKEKQFIGTENLQQNDSVIVKHVHLTPKEQKDFLSDHGRDCYLESNESYEENSVLERYDNLLDEQYKSELWKYCSLSIYGGVYVDSEGIMLQTLEDIFPLFPGSKDLLNGMNYAVLSSTVKGSIHGSLFASSSMSQVSLGMVRAIVETPDSELNPFFLSTKVYELIAQELGLVAASLPLHAGLHQNGNNYWTLFNLQCDIGAGSSVSRPLDLLMALDEQLIDICPSRKKYCCQVVDLCNLHPILITNKPIQPNVVYPPTRSFLHDKESFSNKDQLPIISTIRELTFNRPKNMTPTMNFFGIVQKKGNLPTDFQCTKCLRAVNKVGGARCSDCMDACNNYCKLLCKERPEEKFTAKIFYVSPPIYFLNPERLITRMVHQTWFENTSSDKYPNISRLTESWKNSGYEYKFYDENNMRSFLTEHFPFEVLEAFDALIPGPFKADLFRYCVLLIHGGIYADIDVQLITSLDMIPQDIGFMVPLDWTGGWDNHRHCLWNGFIASAPAHPFLSRAIEIVVNNVRNRFTLVDIDDLLCPNTYVSLTHRSFTLYFTGPCTLGAAVNDVLGRHMQSPFIPGTINKEPLQTDNNSPIENDTPGRSVLLKQNKRDMGAHRFTLLESNMLVATTDIPGSDDRMNVQQKNPHYVFSTEIDQNKVVFGSEKLYKDKVVADELIKIRTLKKLNPF